MVWPTQGEFFVIQWRFPPPPPPLPPFLFCLGVFFFFFFFFFFIGLPTQREFFFIFWGFPPPPPRVLSIFLLLLNIKYCSLYCVSSPAMGFFFFLFLLPNYNSRLRFLKQG